MDEKTGRLLIVFLFLLTILCTISVTLLIAGKPGHVASITPSSNSSIDESRVKEIIEEHLTESPEIIIEAFAEARKKQARLETQNTENMIESKSEMLYNDPETPFLGNPNGKVVLVEFFDYNCGFCRKVTPDLMQIAAEDKDVKLVMKDFPILGEQSLRSARASIAAFNIAPEKFAEYHSEIFRTRAGSDEKLLDLAEKIGINRAALEAELQKPYINNQLQENLALGQENGVRGTPAFIINGEYIRGAITKEQFKERIAVAKANLR